MKSKEEIMSMLEEYEKNNMDIKKESSNSSSKVSAKNPNLKKEQKVKNTSSQRGFLAQTMKEMRAMNEISKEVKSQQRSEREKSRRLKRKLKEDQRKIKEVAKQSKRITKPKKRNIFERVGNVMHLSFGGYDMFEEDVKDYKKGRLSKEDLKLEWEEIQEYEDAKSDIKVRAAWKTFKLALAGLGLAAAVNFGGQFLNSAYEYGYNLTSGFWDKTNESIENQREEYELLHGDYFPNGEKKQKITAEEYEKLSPEIKNSISYIPSLNAELHEDEEENLTVVLPDNNSLTKPNVKEENTKHLERE